jgi:hypothetical protein
MSEVEGDWGDGQSFTDMRPGLGLAQRMVDDLRELEPKAWVFWQPVEDYDNMKPGGESAKGGNWGSIQLSFGCDSADTLETCPIYTNTKFDTARNFTHYIKPGDRLIKTNDTSSTAAVAKRGDKATVVHVNSTTAARDVTLDLSRFGKVSSRATVTAVVTDADGKLVKQRPVRVTGKQATITVPAQSVTSFLVKGVSGVAKNQAELQDGHSYRLTGVQSGKDLSIGADGKSLVIKSAANGGTRWQLDRVGHGAADNRTRYVLTDPAGDKRLAIRDGALVAEPADGRCDTAAQWIMSTTGDSTWTLVNAATGQLPDVYGQSTNEGAGVGIWWPNSGTNQRWKLTDVTTTATSSTS